MYRVTHPVTGVVIECDDVDDALLLAQEFGSSQSEPEDEGSKEPEFRCMVKTANFHNVITLLSKLEKGNVRTKDVKFSMSGACKSLRYVVKHAFRNLSPEDVYVKVSNGLIAAGPHVKFVLDHLVPTRKKGDNS